MAAEGEEEEGEPEGGGFHEEPCHGWGEGGAPPWAVVLAVRGGEELEGEEGGWGYEVKREEGVVEEVLIRIIIIVIRIIIHSFDFFDWVCSLGFRVFEGSWRHEE